MNGLLNKYTVVLTAALVLQGAGYYSAALRQENTPQVNELSSFPLSLANWTTVRETQLDKETLELLRADDILNRDYSAPGYKSTLNFFLAYFKSQRAGQSPHSPKNCLPGSGWEPSSVGFQVVNLPDSGESITVNRYIVARGDQKSVVLYWYQSHGRSIAREASAKFWLVADAIRFNRSDTSLVRVVVPVAQNDEAEALSQGVNFVRSVYPLVARQFPN